MALLVRILMLVAALALGATPAAAHGSGFGGPGAAIDCGGMVSSARADPGHRAPGDTPAEHGRGLAPACVCAMTTTLAEAPVPLVPLAGRAPRAGTAVPTLEGIASPPEPPPPRA